jgi:N-acetylmuramoyl-L-alanine amidase
LAISKRLEKKLQARLPVEVMLTRSRDVFLSLPERTARANMAKADLFLSIHVNSSPNSATHGIETYYLNNTNDRATLRLARLENSSRDRSRPGQRGNDLALILSDLIQTGKSEESIALAQSLQRSLVNQARTHYPEARNLGVKKGPFYVLVGAHMPCVLVETAFLSHAIEGKRLDTSAYQEVLAEGLFQGIARFLRDDIAGNL